MISLNKNILFVILFAFAAVLLNDRSTAQVKKPSPINLERANILRNRTIGNEQVKELIGDVYITRDDMGIECEHAFHYQTIDKIIFTENVHYSDSLRDMWADKVTYYASNDSLEAEGSVKIVQDQYESYSRKAFYSELRQNIYLREKVKMIDLENKVTLTGKLGFGDELMKYARVTGDAHMVKKDSLDKVEMTIDAVKIEYFSNDEISTATDSVKIFQEDVIGYCGVMNYYMGEKRALMVIDPVIFKEADELRGDSIYMYLEDEKLDKIEIFGNASVFSLVEESEKEDKNQMYGKEIYINIVGDNIETIEVLGNARSIYHIFEKNKDGSSDAKGANSVSGDKINLFFVEGKLETIHVSGGTEGKYYPSDYEGEIE